MVGAAGACAPVEAEGDGAEGGEGAWVDDKGQAGSEVTEEDVMIKGGDALEGVLGKMGISTLLYMGATV